jgi:hypothetical protein
VWCTKNKKKRFPENCLPLVPSLIVFFGSLHFLLLFSFHLDTRCLRAQAAAAATDTHQGAAAAEMPPPPARAGEGQTSGSNNVESMTAGLSQLSAGALMK